jgi:formylglycine-generating enzyme
MAGLSVALVCSQVAAQTFSGDMITISSGTATLGMDPADFAAPPPFDAPFHEASLSAFQMSACEVTNEQYVEFLNGALAAGLVEAIQVTQPGPDQGQTLVYGTSSAPAVYQGQALLNLSGTRVMKDHDNGDGDGDSFTGVIEPENPLNICYIGYDQARPAGEQFYVKDPTDPADFDWAALTNYHNYTSETHVEDTSETLNDYAAWPELANFPANMPSVTDVAQWPASFIRWYGAKAFALYYGLDLPTEAQWEYAAQGGSGFAYATSDGTIHGDGSSGVWNHTSANPALGHVQNVKTGEPNPYGLYNMGGNVWEWMEDWYAADFYQDATDVVNTTDTGVKVRRGGSWNYHQYTLRSASRARDEQFKGNDHFGFRVAGAAVSTSVAESEHRGLPAGARLEQNYPNPFNSSTTVRYHVTGSSPVRLDVYDLTGQLITTLVQGYRNPGSYQATWDGTDQRGLAVSTGVYLTEFRANGFTEMKKMILMK